mmetsp:Transcript_9146/g.19712  ORF Transcript_9146/g.19712 Transcript_9146/m.19712 type:complete len:87 (-) Transcript_9146:178-438(-)
MGMELQPRLELLGSLGSAVDKVKVTVVLVTVCVCVFVFSCVLCGLSLGLVSCALVLGSNEWQSTKLLSLNSSLAFCRPELSKSRNG